MLGFDAIGLLGLGLNSEANFAFIPAQGNIITSPTAPTVDVTGAFPLQANVILSSVAPVVQVVGKFLAVSSGIEERMSLNFEKDEIAGIVNRLLDALSLSSQVVGEGLALRRKIGDLRASYFDDLRDGTFTTNLLACFTAARTSNVSLSGLVIVHQLLFNETPVGPISTEIVQVAIVFCLAAESRMISSLEFVSRDDVEVMMKRMKTVFDTARNLAADMEDSYAYQKLTALAGALTNHLANVSRPLPRMLTFSLPVPLPALSLSQRVYYNATRWEEIIQENKIVHPAFCPREIRGLSV